MEAVMRQELRTDGGLADALASPLRPIVLVLRPPPHRVSVFPAVKWGRGTQ